MNSKQNTISKDFFSQQRPIPKPSKWRYFFIFLAILQVVGIGLFIQVMTSAAQMAKDGASGSEFIAMIVYFTIVPAVGFVALINLIGLPIYMAKHRPRTIGLILSIVSLLFSFGLFLYTADIVYQLQFAS